MEAYAVARSVSRYINDRVLQAPGSSARVLAVFRNACDLIVADGDVFAVVASSIGDGPLNLVVDCGEMPFRSLEPGLPVLWDRQHLRLGHLEITLSDVSVWESRPDWAVLRARCPQATCHLSILRRLCQERTPHPSLLELVAGTSSAASDHQQDAPFLRAISALRAGWNSDPRSLQKGVAELAGLGCGLTPSGDDFLVGLMLWVWLDHPHPRRLCRLLAEIAGVRTTTLSAAFLRAAARGHCSPGWHALLAALMDGDVVGLEAAVTKVLSRGASSGADALAGFLWAGSQSPSLEHPVEEA